MLSDKGLLCDECEKLLGHYVTVSARKIHFDGGRVGWGWFEGHRSCFIKGKRDYPRKVGTILREYQAP